MREAKRNLATHISIDPLLCLFIPSLKLCTVCSANPLVEGWHDDDITSLIPFSVVYSELVNFVPLSVANVCGRPKVTNDVRIFSIATWDVLELTT